MGFNFSKESTPATPGDSTSDRQGYTRIEPAFGKSKNSGIEASSKSSSSSPANGIVRYFAGRNGETITLKNNVVHCTWKNNDPEICIVRDMIVIQDEFESKAELEGKHAVEIAGFHIRTRRILEHGGQKGYCLGIDITKTDPQSLQILPAKTTESQLHFDILHVRASNNRSDPKAIKIRIKNTNTKIGNKYKDISVEPVNSNGVVWIRFYY